jgi:hypothetical protein
MSIFDQHNNQENSEELLYQAIKEELKPLLEEWDKKCRQLSGSGTTFMDPDRTKLIKNTSKIVLQFVWRKLGLKIPDYTRQVLDNDFNLMELKQDK